MVNLFFHSCFKYLSRGQLDFPPLIKLIHDGVMDFYSIYSDFSSVPNSALEMVIPFGLEFHVSRHDLIYHNGLFFPSFYSLFEDLSSIHHFH